MPPPPTPLTTDHRKLILRLRVLLQVEPELARLINPEAPFKPVSYDDSSLTKPSLLRPKASRELVIRPGQLASWKRFSSLAPTVPKDSQRISMSSIFSLGGGKRSVEEKRAEEPDKTSAVLAACREDIVALWNDAAVHEVLERRRVDIRGMPGLCVKCPTRLCSTLNSSSSVNKLPRPC